MHTLLTCPHMLIADGNQSFDDFSNLFVGCDLPTPTGMADVLFVGPGMGAHQDKIPVEALVAIARTDPDKYIQLYTDLDIQTAASRLDMYMRPLMVFTHEGIVGVVVSKGQPARSSDDLYDVAVGFLEHAWGIGMSLRGLIRENVVVIDDNFFLQDASCAYPCDEEQSRLEDLCYMIYHFAVNPDLNASGSTKDRMSALELGIETVVSICSFAKTHITRVRAFRYSIWEMEL